MSVRYPLLKVEMQTMLLLNAKWDFFSYTNIKQTRKKVNQKETECIQEIIWEKIDHVFILFVVLKSATGHLFIKILVPYQTPRESQPWISSIRRRGNDKKTSST